MGCWITAVILLLTFGVIAAVLIPTMGGLAAVWALVQGGDTLEEGVGSVIEAIEDGEVPGLSGTPILEIPEVSATQTPTAAEVVFEVGERGINPGQFNDARAVAVDETGTIYVADRDSGRFQIFAADGSFQSLLPWDDSSFTSDLAIAPNSNEFYAIFGSHIYRYDRTTGEQLGEIVYADSVGSTFRGLATAVNGDILAINGSPRTLVRFDAAGNLLFAVSVEDIPSAIFFEDVAVDGLGNLYVTGTAEDALGDRQDVVFKFTAEGQLISQFGQSGREPGTFMGTVSAITVDGQGHIYVSDFQGIQIFDNNGRYLDIIKLDGIAFQMAFNQDGELIAISIQEKLYKFAINELGN